MTESNAVADAVDPNDVTNEPADDQPEPAKGLTEDQLKAKRYSAEAAGWRKKLRAAEARIKELEGGKGGDGDEGDGAPTPNSPSFLQSELATLRRQVKESNQKIGELTEKWTAAENKSRRTAHENLVSRLTSGLNSPGSAIELLLGKTKLSDDEKTLVYTTKDKDTGETVEVEVTRESLRGSGLLDPIFFPAEGAKGNGTGPTGEVKTRSTLDLTKINDAAYFRENKDAILKATRKK